MSTFGSGSKTGFKRSKSDFYATPYKAVLPLIPHLNTMEYIEPCAGKNDLVKHLGNFNIYALFACDINPRDENITKADASNIQFDRDGKNITFITNPPFKKELLKPILDNLIPQGDVWLLLPAAFMHNKWSIPYLQQCSKIVSIGRIKWFPDSKYSSTDDFAWYNFNKFATTTEFVGRQK